MKKVFELIRVSTEGQAAEDRASIPAQRAANRQTCLRYGLEIVRSFEISDVSGSNVLRAPEMLEMLELIKDPEIDGVVTREFSRLMRPDNYADYGILQHFIDTSTLLYFPDGPLDLASKTGRLFGTMRAAFAGYERREILERIFTAKEVKRKRGELAQSPIVLPFGVGYRDGQFFYKPESEKVREAFRQFLAGNQSYSKLARIIGVTPRGMHLIMRNPIWTGWRVIDKKRDLSSAGRYSGVNGRQADRKKIPRKEDEIIRVRVIEKPLLSEADFAAVQQLMDRKQAKHWRCQNRPSRFTYNGFLTCAACGDIIHTALARRDYYTCKGRRLNHTCTSAYMSRQKLEKILDELFSIKLSNPKFLQQCVQAFEEGISDAGCANRRQQLTNSVNGLRRKRERVVELYLEGIIDRTDRDSRLQAIDEDLRNTQNELMRVEAPNQAMHIDTLIEMFAPLAQWEFWSRADKRLVLSTLVPDIRVANYTIESLGLPATLFSSESTHMDMGSWQPPT